MDTSFRILIFIVAIALFAIGAFFCYLGKKHRSVFASAIVCLVFAFLPMFEWFKTLGLEAKLRSTVDKANVTIDQLQSLSKPLSKIMFSSVAHTNRWGSRVSRSELFRMAHDLEEELIKLQIPKSEIEDAKREFHRCNILDLSYPIFQNIRDHLKNKINEQLRIMDSTQKKGVIDPSNEKYLEANSQRIMLIKEKDKWDKIREQQYTSPESMHIYIGIVNFISDTTAFSEDEKKAIHKENKEALEDLKYYEEHKRFKDLQKWLDGE